MSAKYLHETGPDLGSDLNRERLAQTLRQLFPRRIHRVLLVNTPQIAKEAFVLESARLGRYPSFPPYGIALLGRILKSRGYEVKLVDLHLDLLRNAHSSDGPDAFTYEVWESILAPVLSNFDPDVVGLSCMFNLGHTALRDVASYLKRVKPETPVVAGGVHPSLVYQQVLKDIPAIDLVTLYEADESFEGLLEFLNGRRTMDAISGLVVRSGGENLTVVPRGRAPQLSAVLPWYDDLPVGEYARVGKVGAFTFLRDRTSPAATVLSNRGCRAACTFCSVRSVSGVGVRSKDFTAVVDEVEWLKKTYGISHLMWLDDDLFYDADRATRLFEELARRKLGITWDASNGVIAASLNRRLLQACADSGCVGFNLGLESGSPTMLKEMRKPGTVGRYLRAAELLSEFPSIFTKGFVIIGMPGETLEQMAETVQLAMRMGLDWYPSQILTPMPGTPVFQMMLDQDRLQAIPETELGRGRNFSVGVTGSFRRREEAERTNARPYRDPFFGDPEHLPVREELEDIYVAMDYRMNYEPIFLLECPAKIEKKRRMLEEICLLMTAENPLATFFWAITEKKRGEFKRAEELFRDAETYLEKSQFWQYRFESLGILDRARDFFNSRIKAGSPRPFEPTLTAGGAMASPAFGEPGPVVFSPRGEETTELHSPSET